MSSNGGSAHPWSFLSQLHKRTGKSKPGREKAGACQQTLHLTTGQQATGGYIAGIFRVKLQVTEDRPGVPEDSGRISPVDDVPKAELQL